MDVANAESDGPPNWRSQRVAAAGTKEKMASAEVEGAALDAIVEVMDDLGVRLWDVPHKTLVYIGVRRWVIECKVPVVRVEVLESNLRSSKLHGEDTRDICYDTVTKKMVVLPQPHPILYSLATSLKLNTDSRHGMRFLFMMHRQVMPTLLASKVSLWRTRGTASTSSRRSRSTSRLSTRSGRWVAGCDPTS